jgi:hypothetical protein
MSHLMKMLLLVVCAATPLASCGDPCDEAFEGKAFCEALKTSLAAKCDPGLVPSDCGELMKKLTSSKCTASQRYCKTEGQTCLDNIAAAADCDSAMAVTCTHVCFD